MMAVAAAAGEAAAAAVAAAGEAAAATALYSKVYQLAFMLPAQCGYSGQNLASEASLAVLLMRSWWKRRYMGSRTGVTYSSQKGKRYAAWEGVRMGNSYSSSSNSSSRPVGNSTATAEVSNRGYKVVRCAPVKPELAAAVGSAVAAGKAAAVAAREAVAVARATLCPGSIRGGHVAVGGDWGEVAGETNKKQQHHHHHHHQQQQQQAAATTTAAAATTTTTEAAAAAAAITGTAAAAAATRTTVM
jgi:hypothetical protein